MLLTDRDVEILRWVSDCRFLTREQTQRLLFTPGATSSCKCRLTLLYHNGHLGRLLLPVPNAFGATRAVYHLDRRGAALLQHLGRDNPVGWRARDSEREIFFIAHTLDINDVRIALTVSARAHGFRVTWTDEAGLRRMNIRRRVRGQGVDSPLIPDAYFLIGAPGGVDGFALEVDRATVTERRMRARIRAYGEWASSGAYLRELPTDSFRVIFAVTDSRRDPRRLSRLKAWCEEEGGGSLFWFVARDGVDADDILAAPVWLVAGEPAPRRLALSGNDG